MEKEAIHSMTKVLITSLTENIDYEKVVQIVITAIIAFFFNKKVATPTIKKILTRVKGKINEKIDSIIDQSMLRLGTMQSSKEIVTSQLAQEMQKIDAIIKNIEETSMDFDVMARFDEKSLDIDKKIKGVEESMERRMRDFEIKMNALIKSVTQCVKKKEIPVVQMKQQLDIQPYTKKKKEYDPHDKL
uniref:NSP4 n=1 Tax=Rotavirus G TaxID=183407 RepID=A0A345ANN3_9REOV|nr:NSP4 [Rotavirus G]